MSREMKDSGIEWINKTPLSWKVVRIKNTSWLKGRIGWQGLTANEYLEVGAYLITGTDFKDGYINWDSCVHISEERYNEAPEIHIKEDDLLITKDGTIGKLAIAKNCPKQVSLNSGVMLIRNTKNIKYFDKFLYYVLMSQVFWHWFMSSMTGNSTIIHLYQEQFYEFKYFLPEYTEQITISDYLNRKCADIDKLILLQEQMVDELKAYKKSVITEAVTKGLDKSVPMKNSGIEWIGEIPEHYNSCSLKFYAQIKGRIGFKGYSVEDLVSEDTLGRAIVLGGTNIMKEGYISYDKTTYLSEFKYFESPEIMLKGDEIIITKVGAGCGENAIYNYKEERVTINPNVMVVIPKKINGKLLNYIILSDYIKKWLKLESTKSGAQPAINQEHIKNLKIPFSNKKNEQETIVEYLDKKCNEINKLILIKQTKINELKEYKKSLIYECVTGKREVS